MGRVSAMRKKIPLLERPVTEDLKLPSYKKQYKQVVWYVSIRNWLHKSKLFIQYIKRLQTRTWFESTSRCAPRKNDRGHVWFFYTPRIYLSIVWAMRDVTRLLHTWSELIALRIEPNLLWSSLMNASKTTAQVCLTIYFSYLSQPLK